MDKAISSGVLNFNTWPVMVIPFYLTQLFSLVAIFPFRSPKTLVLEENVKLLFVPATNTQTTNNAHNCLSKREFSSVAQSCPTLCDPMNHSTPGLPVRHQLLEFTQTHVHWVGDAIQPSHPLSSTSPAVNLSQHQGLFKWVSSSHQVAKILEFQLQHQSFQWTLRTDLL